MAPIARPVPAAPVTPRVVLVTQAVEATTKLQTLLMETK